MNDPEQEARQPDDPRQRSLDFVRAEQLRLLRDCELPKDAKDAAGKGVRANVLKSLLIAIDQYGRGRAGGAWASVATLAANANIGPRTATRAIEVLQALGVVCVTNDGSRWGTRGSPTNRYTIVWSELALLVDHQPLARRAPRGANDHRATDSATGADQSATGADQSATGADQSATGADQSATVAHKTPTSNGYEALQEAPSDVGVDGARYFFGDEVAAVRAKANTINAWAQARTLADRELVLKIATLWEDGELSEDVMQQTLESFERARERGEHIARPFGWLWTTLRNQCRQHTIRLEKLLAMTDFPRELLASPATQEVG